MQSWTDSDNETQQLGLGDILVVAPFNAQVSLLADHLGPGARDGAGGILSVELAESKGPFACALGQGPLN